MNKEYEMYERLARQGTLPANFDQWGLDDGDGWTIAHAAAQWGRLPKYFNQWDLADSDGRTVAHIAAANGSLPVDFNQWDLADSDGWAVAHVAAINEHLPADLPSNFCWNLLSYNGRSVAQLAPEVHKQWHVLRGLDSTCSDTPDTQNSQMI
jgi:hypothetical protein